MGILRDRQEQAGRAADPAEMIEADAGEFGEGDGQDGEIDAGDAEAEREKADERRRPAAAIGIAANSPSHGPMPKCT